MHEFRTRHAEFDGFSDFFAKEVHPVLSERDSARSTAVRKGLLYGITGGVLLGAAGITLLLMVEESIFGLIGLGLAVMVPILTFWVMTHDIREETKSRIVNAIVGYVGWSFTPEVAHHDIRPYQNLFLVGQKVDRMSFEDSLNGQAHGASFHSVEAHLEKEGRDHRGRKTWRTVFRGQLMTLEFPTRTFGRTIVLRDKGWFNPKAHADMKRIGLVDPVFEGLFEAYGTDQVEGRVILDPVFMQRMVDLEKAVTGKNIRFGFDRNTLFIAIETPDQFEAGSMFASLTDPRRTQKILDEVGAIYDIVDRVLEPRTSQ